jgi:hypothetical protein
MALSSYDPNRNLRFLTAGSRSWLFGLESSNYLSITCVINLTDRHNEMTSPIERLFLLVSLKAVYSI